MRPSKPDPNNVCNYFPTSSNSTTRKKYSRNSTMRTSASAPFLPVTRKSSANNSSSNLPTFTAHQPRPIRAFFSSLSRLRPTRSARLLFQKTTYLHFFLLPAFLILVIELFPSLPPSSTALHGSSSTRTGALNARPALQPSSDSSFLSNPWHSKSVPVSTRQSNSFPFPKQILPGASIVAVCMNRHETLRHTLPTWQAVNNVSEIILVDWSSDPPLSSIVSELASDDPRVRVLRVENESSWVLTRAYNLALSTSGHEIVIRTDCDYSLEPDFLSAHPLSRSVTAFYAGNYASARNENEAHLNGAVMIRREDFFAVGGYDERIQTYGWDDEDLYSRLQGVRNLSKLNISFDHVGHVRHTDSTRAQHDVKFVQVEIDLNSMLLKHLGAWNSSSGLAAARQWSLLRDRGNELRGRYASVSAAVSGLKPRPLKELVSKHDYEEAWKLSLGQRLANDYQMPWDIMETMPATTRRLLLSRLTKRMARRREAVSPADREHVKPARMLFVHCMHGLGNRLRALASAMSFANATDREVVVVWEKDAHIAAHFDDLFETDDIVVMSHFKPKWPFTGYEKWDRAWTHFKFYNYMEMEKNGAVKGQKIVDHPDKHMYIKSAYIMEVLDPTLTNWEQDNKMLKSLTPVAEVRRMVQLQSTKELEKMVGVHIRDRTLTRDIKNVDFGSEYGASASTEMEYWRQKSSYRNFIAEMWRMVEHEPDLKFYVATDTAALFPTLEKEFPDRIVYTHRDCDGRDGSCIRFALIDLLCLAKTKALVGSNWSSFTEAASRFGARSPRLSGVDFAIDHGLKDSSR